MPFPRRYLQDNEEIILDRKPHWLLLAKPVAIVAVVAIVGSIASQKINPGSGTVNGWITWASLIAGLIAVLYLARCVLKWSTTNFVLTTDRLITRSGVVAKRGKEIPLERINDIASSQTVFERMIGAGDLVIESGGENGQEHFLNVRSPFDVKNQIYRQIELAQNRTADRTAGARQLSVPEQLEKLDELRQRGVVTQAEFDAKKAQLLDKM